MTDANKVALKKWVFDSLNSNLDPDFVFDIIMFVFLFYNLNLKFENILPNWTLILCPPWCLSLQFSIHIQFIYSNFYLHFAICLQKFIFMEFWITTYIIAALQWFLVWCFCFKITKKFKNHIEFLFFIFLILTSCGLISCYFEIVLTNFVVQGGLKVLSCPTHKQ